MDSRDAPRRPCAGAAPGLRPPPVAPHPRDCNRGTRQRVSSAVSPVPMQSRGRGEAPQEARASAVGRGRERGRRRRRRARRGAEEAGPQRHGERIADERHDVEHGVRDHERHHAAPAPVAPAEHHAHREVADDRADALVRVIRAAQRGRRQDDRPPRPSRAAAAGRTGTPMKMTSSVSPARSAASSSSGTVHHAASSGEACTCDGDARARGRPRRARAPGMPDRGGEQDAAARVAAELAEVQPDAPERVAARAPTAGRRTSATSASPKKIGEQLVEDVPERLDVARRDSAGSAARRSASVRASARTSERTEYSADCPTVIGEDDPDLPPQADAGAVG